MDILISDWLFVHTISTPDNWQLKLLLTIDERGSKIARNRVFDCHLSQIAICRLTVTNGNQNNVSNYFYLHSSIVLTFSIVAYPV